MTSAEFRLLNEFQRGFPLCRQPFAVLAERLQMSERTVLERLRAFYDQGVVSRVGAVFAPRSIGASTLAALSVPDSRLEHVAAAVSARPEVNHNYEREHRYNLWFVGTAPDQQKLDDVLREIEREARCGRVLSLPLIEEYRIDLGFDLSGAGLPQHTLPPARSAARVVLQPEERRLVAALQSGLPLVPSPYAAVADAAGLGEHEVLARLERWIEEGTIRRFGVILRHRELGYRANAMAVWDVPDAQTDALGARLAGQQDVTLCYRRGRALPEWRYNLFCMIHGRSRETVQRRLAELEGECGLGDFDCAVLFSRRRFKQCGARHVESAEPSHV
ncbi:MAG TPA: Lrp/AsnC family transcriptional regulator [Burkholderiales bacterium]|nr:Lrp/AsnC family transcriptional regulator [Burkholderiales bacterium]